MKILVMNNVENRKKKQSMHINLLAQTVYLVFEFSDYSVKSKFVRIANIIDSPTNAMLASR